MNLECELKFLVKSLDLVNLTEVKRKTWRQGYLKINESNFIQARLSADIDNQKGFINLKGVRTDATRPEYGCKINFDTAIQVISKCDNQIIKTRHYYEKDLLGYEWIIDEYHGANDGLLIAELEFTDEQLKSFANNVPSIEPPSWTYLDITDDESFYNYFIAEYPIKSHVWKVWNSARRYFISEFPEYKTRCTNEFERLNLFIKDVFENKNKRAINLLLKMFACS